MRSFRKSADRGNLAWVAAVAVLGAGCLNTTLKRADPGAAVSKDSVVLVGSLRVVPAVTQHVAHGPNAILLGEMQGNFLATFTRDLKRPFRANVWPPIENAQTAWVPMEGTFYVEVPAGRPLYLRGLSAMTNLGRVDVEMPLKVDLRPGDQVVYVGHLHFIRSSPSKVLVKDRRKNLEEDAKASGRGALLRNKWVTRLARPAEEEEDPGVERARMKNAPTEL